MSVLIQMAGFPGSGKSTLSNIISKNIGAIVLDRDVIKNSMCESGIEGKLLAEASYKVLFDLASDLLSKGHDVIIDTPCYYHEIVKTGQCICEANQSKYKFVECIVNEHTIINQRLKSRNRLQTQIESVSEENYYAQYDQSSKPKDIQCLTVDTSDFERIEISKIIAYIQA